MKGKTAVRETAGPRALEYILIAIVVIVLVGVVWLFLGGYFNVATANPKAAVQQFDISVASDGRASVVLVIKNTGNVRITSASILSWLGLLTGATEPKPLPRGL